MFARSMFERRPLVRSMAEAKAEQPRPTSSIVTTGEGQILKGSPWTADPPPGELVQILHNPGNTGQTGY